jgi:hypothetical protein
VYVVKNIGLKKEKKKKKGVCESNSNGKYYFKKLN